MCVAILFGAFNDFAIKSPVGALTGHAGICEVAAEHSRGLVGDFRRFSVDVWCLNWVKKRKKKIEHNTLFINIPSNKQHWLQMHHCHWLLIRYSYNLHLDLDTQQLSLKEKKKKFYLTRWHHREGKMIENLFKRKKKNYTHPVKNSLRFCWIILTSQITPHLNLEATT